MDSSQPNVTPKEEAVLTTIVSGIAERTGRNPKTMPPIEEEVDADALQQFLDHSPDTVRVSFEYQGQRIEVEPGGDVRVQAAGEE